MSALRACPGCGDRRILLPARGQARMCVDCRDHPQGRLFTLEATLEDLDFQATSCSIEREIAGLLRAPRCRCDQPLGDGEGGCVLCGRWATA